MHRGYTTIYQNKLGLCRVKENSYVSIIHNFFSLTSLSRLFLCIIKMSSHTVNFTRPFWILVVTDPGWKRGLTFSHLNILSRDCRCVILPMLLPHWHCSNQTNIKGAGSGEDFKMCSFRAEAESGMSVALRGVSEFVVISCIRSLLQMVQHIQIWHSVYLCHMLWIFDIFIVIQYADMFRVVKVTLFLQEATCLLHRASQCVSEHIE